MNADQALKILVVAYSRTGTTGKIATELARQCGADLEEIRDVRSRKGIVGYFRSAKEALQKTQSPIRTPVRNWSDYDVVVIGTPVWAGHVSSPIRTYLSQRTKPARRVAFFCTMGGRGAQSVFAELSQLTQMTPTATLALADEQISKQRYGELLSEFATKIAEKRTPSREPAGESLLTPHAR